MNRETNLSIHTENILPIIRDGFIPIKIYLCVKWYQIQVMRLVNLKSSFNQKHLRKTRIFYKVIVDKDNKTIQFIDNGIGMTVKK